jgi:hypothetical protein
MAEIGEMQMQNDRGIPRRIVGYRTDEEGYWVAVLDCGHGQHVRHDPPWQQRPWVVSEQGRAEHLNTILRCVRCLEGDNDGLPPAKT